ncbi:PIN domain-containing protein [Cyanobium sp. T1G-Tous]|uniref:TA system VapC family ribonuclease toxin n=1 Tax=Cyanobium sp. T1G-Tous TaxID=2823722 RepID=UPI0020CB8321|nr:TA system VapC family ribonuclease toxin [Cyanobium sp. T1G-Tous]MCP9804523.1 PIN domain-containing protein [Cyanobium sp. T1G-Tous]
MAPALLDINVVIALLDQGHLLHRAATRWLEREFHHGWATCPITENGVVRIMTQPAYPNAQPTAQVAERLAEACRDPSHRFWPEPISLLEAGLIRWERLLGPRQITDAYLLALAAHHGGRFVSFDQRINLDAVPGAGAGHLCIIDCE